MEIEKKYRRIKNELEDKFVVKNNVCFENESKVIYKNGNIINHIEKLNLEVMNNIPKSYLRIGLSSNQNLFYIIIISQGKAKNLTTNDETEVSNICKKIIKYSTLEPIDYIEKLYKVLNC